MPIRPSLPALLLAAAVTGAGLVAAGPPAAAAPVVPAGFTDQVVLTGLNQPTAVSFAPDGRVFVAEKSGAVRVFDSLTDPTPGTVADLRTQTHNFWDRGLLGMALDPQFPTRPYLYVLYTYDAEPGGSAPRWGSPGVAGDGCPTPPGATTDGCVVQSRLSRLTLSGDVMTAETPLVTGWCQQFPSHSTGTVLFGPDGALYAGAGDGASFNYADWGQTKNLCGDPPGVAGIGLTAPTARGGALRAQSPRRPAGEPVLLNGSIIRVNPDTGAGMPGNPYAASADPNARRIIAYGLRNPFRFTARPGTDQLWLGDVGWSTWEEIDRIPDVNDGVAENFGWPCYEGTGRQGAYDAANLGICEGLYAGPGQTPPVLAYAHSAKVVAGDACPTGSSAIGGLAFENGSNYPAAYDGAVFFSDATRGCIWAMQRGGGADPGPTHLVPVVSGAGTPVQVVTGPGGDVFWVDLGGSVHRLLWTGANHPPTAVLDATPTSGPAPLTVSFSAGGSSDVDGGPLAYAWDLDGDGGYDDSTAVAPTRTYTATGTVRVRLRVTDPGGASDTEEVTISVGVATGAPTPVIDTPTGALRWSVGDPIAFSGHATDPQDGTLPAAALSWSLILQHCPSNCHAHPVQDFAGVASGTFPAPDHEYPSWLELRLTATDSAGLSTSTSLRLDPRTAGLTVASAPAGLRLGLGAEAVTAPATRTVIAGSSSSVSAPLTQTTAAGTYDFVSWSDGGPASHNVVAPAAGTTVTAAYQQVTTGCPATPTRYARIPGAGAPAGTRLPDGWAGYATVGSDGRVYLVRSALTSAPPAAGPLECLGGAVVDNPALAGDTVFARVPDGRLYSRPLTGGGWAPLPAGGTSPNGPAAAVAADGTTYLVVRGGNGAVYVTARTGATWSAWRNLGGAILGTPAVAARPGGGVLIAARATNNQLYGLSGGGASWTGWSALGLASATGPAAAQGFAAGRTDLFAVHSAGGLFQNAYTGGAWTGWRRLDSVAPPAARIAAAATDQRIVVHSAAAGATSYRQYAGGWSGYQPAPYTCASCRPPG